MNQPDVLPESESARPFMDNAKETRSTRVQNSVERAFSFNSLSAYGLGERFLIRLADAAFFLLIAVIGRTVRWEVEGWNNFEAALEGTNVPIYCFWHNRVFLATYFWRRRGIVVMTSQSFDGEYIARFIRRFGYGAARGSSTRGGVGALVEMVRLMNAGLPAAFTIDGPKGPRYVAKMGALLLAKKTGHPVLPFTITATKHLTMNSWDHFEVPLPFTRARVEIAPPIFVDKDADDNMLENKRQELQIVLDELTKRGEEWRNH